MNQICILDMNIFLQIILFLKLVVQEISNPIVTLSSNVVTGSSA